MNIERIVGGTEVQKKEAKERLQEVFDTQNREAMAELEVEKSQEVLKSIDIANQATSIVLAEYGIQKNDIGADKIHVIKKESWPEKLSGSSAFFNLKFQGVAISDGKPQVALLHDLIHEIFHFKSYLAAQITLHDSLDQYRVGFSVTTRDGEKVMFRNIDEAITEELTYQAAQTPVFKEMMSDELKRIKRDVGQHSDSTTEDGRPLFNDQTYYVEVGEEREDGSSPVHAKEFTYQKEREALKLLSEKLYEHNKPSFRSADEVFALFVKSAFTGNLLKIGRLIEDTFGVGTLRKIADHDSEDDFLRLISSLA